MSLAKHELYRTDVLEYLERRGYTSEAAHHWVEALMGQAPTVSLVGFLDPLFSAWEERALPEEQQQTDLPTPDVQRALAKRTIRWLLEQELVRLGLRDRVLQTKLVPRGDQSDVCVELLGSKPLGVKFPTEHDGVQVRFYFKTI